MADRDRDRNPNQSEETIGSPNEERVRGVENDEEEFDDTEDMDEEEDAEDEEEGTV